MIAYPLTLVTVSREIIRSRTCAIISAIIGKPASSPITDIFSGGNVLLLGLEEQRFLIGIAS
jgi:hypothetical protein